MVSQKAPGQSVGMDAPSTTGSAIPESLGRYRLLSKIAKGGMAEVFAARSYGVHGFEKTVALKRILPRFGQDPQFVRMMVDEAKISVLLNHPNIAQILELGEQPADEGGGHEYFIVMEFVAGQSLSAVVKRLKASGERFPQLEACFIVVELLQGLHAAHIQTDMSGKPASIIHRDVSPQNTLVSFDGHVKVIDFGIARARDRLEATEVGTIKGKLRYLAPEMIDPGRFCEDGDFDHRVDVFAAGIVLWELVSGRTLFPGDEELKVYDDITDGVTPDLHKEGFCDAALMKIINKALERRLERRYESAEEFADDLRAYVYRKDPGFTHKRVASILEKHFPDEKAELVGLERGMSAPEIVQAKHAAQKKAAAKAMQSSSNSAAPRPSNSSSKPEPAETRHMRSDSHARPAAGAAPAADAATAIADVNQLDPNGELAGDLPKRKELTVVTLVSRQHVMGTAANGGSDGSGVFSMPDDATLTVSADTLREEKARFDAMRAKNVTVSSGDHPPLTSSANLSTSGSRSAMTVRDETPMTKRRPDDRTGQRAAVAATTRRRLIAASAAVGVLLALAIVAVMEIISPAPKTGTAVIEPANPTTTPATNPTTNPATNPTTVASVAAPVHVVVRCAFVGASVTVDVAGQSRSGLAPFAVDARAGDTLQVKVSAPGTRDEVQSVVVPEGHSGDFFVDIAPHFVPVPVRLDVNPKDAEVLVNGEIVSKDTAVEPGVAVVVDVSAPGHVSVRQELKAVPGQPLIVTATLEKEKSEKATTNPTTTKKPPPPPPPPPPPSNKPGTLALKTTPYWGTVTIDGKLYDEQTPLSVTLPAGKHDVVVAHPPKGLVRKFKVVIKPGETVTRMIPFE